MSLTIISPLDRTLQAALATIPVTAQDTHLNPGDTITWTSDDPDKLEFSADSDTWDRTCDTSIDSTGQTTCYMRWMRSDVQSPPGGTTVRATQKDVPGNATANTYFLKVIKINGVGNYVIQANNPASGTLDPNEPTTRIAITTAVTDLENVGIPDWPVTYVLRDQNRPVMWPAPGQPDPTETHPGGNMAYTFTTDARGEVNAFIGSPFPVIVTVDIQVLGYGESEATVVLVTPAPNTASPIPAPLIAQSSNPLDLDDGNGITFDAYLDSSIGQPGSVGNISPFSMAAFVLNGTVMKIGTVRELQNHTALSTGPLITDGTTQNRLHVIIQTTGNCYQSLPNVFLAKGHKVLHPDPALNRILDAPLISDPIVNWNAIAQNLSVTIPPYSNIPSANLGSTTDQVTVSVYLNAYYSGTDNANAKVIQKVQSPQNATEVANGFTVTFDRELLLGFDEGRTAREGRFECEYTVVNPAYGNYATRHSRVLGSLRWIILGTVPPGG
jgi:hypothetical protein